MKPRRPQNPWRLQKVATISVLALIMLNEKTQVNSVTVAYCGDGIINQSPVEGCDDGNSKKGDGCSATCTVETGFTCTVANPSVCTETCGDGKNFKSVSTTTQCDDDNEYDHDGCSQTCVIETGWRCSGGSSTTRDYCYEICGDGYNFDTTGNWAVGDKCDDKNTVRYDGCFNCRTEEGWYCEPGSQSDTSTATLCYEIPMDGLDFGTYECDVDGNSDACYDGAIVDGWECDGGTKSNGDTCTEICGDGIHHSTVDTDCDDGNYVDYDGCSSSCVAEDGFTLTGTVGSATPQTFDEDCDGYDYGYLDCDCGAALCDGCTASCTVVKGYSCLPPDDPADMSDCTEICGDSINYDSSAYDVFVGEICDDGNTRNNDGCSGTCIVETGFACSTTTTTTKDTCYEICGDGLDYKRYACDDGNSNDYDGCSSTCTVNAGWTCSGGTKTTADTCIETCGDGRNYAYWHDDTSCDDGNNDDYDGCDSECNIETGYDCVGGDYDSADYCYETCGDGMRFNTLETYCDDGNTDYDDGCDENCFVEEGFYCYGGDATAYDTCFEDCGDSLRFTGSGITTFCDDGNTEPDDGCDAICAVEEGWYCYGGSKAQSDTCYEICGDGYDFGEFECDDGNEDSYDGCSSSCEVEDHYECYGGTTDQADTCYDVCGDGYDMGLNECDDGDLDSLDGCLSDCTMRDGWNCINGDHTTASTCYEICGDGYHYYYDAGSLECDDGNNYDHDGCDSTCGREAGFTCTTTWTTQGASSPAAGYNTASSCTEICQDGMNFNDDYDYCDTGDAAGTNGCTYDCQVVDGWYCDFGGYTSKDYCYEKCGDDYNWGTLECDYLGYDVDGCSSSCEVEDGWYCLLNGVEGAATLNSHLYIPHACYEICGDSYDFGTFDCDDGNNDYDDGCNADCGLEEGWYCDGGSYDGYDTCGEICGDQFNLNLLPCDDGNDYDGDGCYECAVEDGWYCPDYEVQNPAFTGTYATHYYPNYCYDICGDGKLVDDTMYACDDYDNTDGDGCSAKCQIERGHYCVGGDATHTDVCYETCGDGFNYPSTSGDCDDGGVTSGDGCSSKCEIEDGWYCFGGTSLKRDYCYEVCGDDYDHGKYPCDDGDRDDYDGCDSDCHIEDGWYCYGGSSTGNDKCYDICNDGKVMPDGNPSTTYCDDGNSDQTDGCTTSCRILDGWVCQGGDSTAADTCYEICGDGIDYGTDECDDDNTYDGDGCSASCEIETGYDCTGGTTTGADTCKEICGDAYDFGFYECDDGNQYDGDGCDSSCVQESGYDCTGGSSTTNDVCSPVCGDTLIRSTETCDDGNAYDNDGCSSDCLIESQYDCDGAEPSTCYEICGDGLNMGQVECDDGGYDSYDGCSSSCEVEDGWKCSGGDHSTADTCTETDYISNSLDECTEFASKFSTTCTEDPTDDAPASVAAVAGQSHTCEDNYGGLCAAGNTKDANGYCTWSRKLCVTCSKDFSTGYVMIRVQTNSLPDHCYYANKYAPIENLIDFSVGFSLQNNTADTPRTVISTQTDLDAQLCSYAWPNKTAQIANLASMQYTVHSAGTDIDKVVGIALNGVPIFFGTSELGFDVFKPKAYNGQSAKSVAVDLCLGNNDYTRYYHYYTNSPCILPGTQKAAVAGGLCTDDTNCNTNKTKFIVAARSSLKNLQVIGLARDGRKIMGPYKADGSVWSACEVDVCNGVIINDEYVYVTTTFHPYTVACFSRGNYPSLTPKCTTNPRQCTGSSSTDGIITTFSYLSALTFIVLALLLQ